MSKDIAKTLRRAADHAREQKGSNEPIAGVWTWLYREADRIEGEIRRDTELGRRFRDAHQKHSTSSWGGSLDDDDLAVFGRSIREAVEADHA